MADDRELDRMLEEELTAVPPPGDQLTEITPWRRAIARLIGGSAMVLFAMTPLGYLMNVAGVLLMMLGFRMLRRENRWFAAGWLLSMANMALMLVYLAWPATAYWTLEEMAVVNLLATAALLGQYFCLWWGVRAVRRASGRTDQAGSAGLLFFSCLLGTAVSLSGLRGLLPGLAIAALLIFALFQLGKVGRLMDGVGYAVKMAPVRTPEWAVWLVWLVCCALCVPLAGAIGAHYPMDWTPREPIEHTALEAIRTDLLNLGMPPYVLEDLTVEEIRALKEAVRMEVSIDTQPFNEGREFRGANFRRTVYDVREMLFTSVAVEMPDGRWRVIHHFVWQNRPEIRGGTDYILLSTPYNRNEEDWLPVGEPTASGRLLYDQDGVTYVGDFYELGIREYLIYSMFEDPQPARSPYAAFTFPKEGERFRGYLIYETEPLESAWILDSWIYYTHQDRPFNYPFVTAKMSYEDGWNSRYYQTRGDAVQVLLDE